MTRSTSRVAWTLGTWFGCGLVPWAPGTAGTLGAVPLYLLVSRGGPVHVAIAAAVVTFIGVWAASVASREAGQKDPQRIVIDEVAGFLVTMVPIDHPSWRATAAGFVVFRVLDALKPWPVRRLEFLPSGWGIVLDDVGAGAIGAILLVALLRAGVWLPR